MRVNSLTFLRFVAAYIVVIFHYGKATSLAAVSKPFLISGPPMVTFFFVLSGFVMMVSQYNKSNFTAKSYYKARIARIVPLYLFALIIVAFFYFGKNQINGIMGLFLSLTFLQSWFSKYSLAFNSPGWSLSVEFFFYFIFPIIFIYIKEKKVDFKRVIIFAACFWFFTQLILINFINSKHYMGFPTDMHALVYYFPVSHVCSFILGLSVGYYFLKVPRKTTKTYSYIYDLVFFLSALLVYLCLQNPNILVNFFEAKLPFGSSFYAPLFAIFILAVSLSTNIINKFFSLKLFLILGEASYGVYILQKPVYLLYEKFIKIVNCVIRISLLYFFNYINCCINCNIVSN